MLGGGQLFGLSGGLLRIWRCWIISDSGGGGYLERPVSGPKVVFSL